MSSKKPLCNYSGEIKELQAADWVPSGVPKVISLTRDASAVAGNASYTGIGFKPSAIMLTWVNQGTPQTGEAMITAADVRGKTYTTQWYNTNEIVDLYVAGGRTWASLVTLDSDGFTFNWQKTSSPTGTINMQCICFR